MSFSDIVNIISAVSGVMTILGISGIATWSLIDKRRASFEDNVIGVMAVTTKIALSGLILLPVCYFAALTQFFAATAITDAAGGGSFLWDSKFATAHLLGYVIAAIIWLPLLVLSVASVFSWSLSPFVRFYRALSKRRDEQRTSGE